MTKQQNWEKLLCSIRYSKENIQSSTNTSSSHEENFSRNPFHKDYDRIIFSKAFRRLSKKTQVHPLIDNDHVHNRLTHSLEVASVGRTLGLGVGKWLHDQFPEIDAEKIGYITQTACLAHDIGNPPFGHSGEEVIKEWFINNEASEFLSLLKPNELLDFQNFDGNAQSFRIVSQLANNKFNGGLQLTYASLGCLVKYPYTSDITPITGKFNFFQSESLIANKIFAQVGLVNNDKILRHPLSYLMEAADDICYALLDIQDAYDLKLISIADVAPIFEKLCEQDISDLLDHNLSRFVAMAVNQLTNYTLAIFKENIEQILSDKQPKSLIDLFPETHQLHLGIQAAKKLGQEKIYNNKRNAGLLLGSYQTIETLLNQLIPAVYEFHQQDKISHKSKMILAFLEEKQPSKELSLYNKYQLVIDYIVGMTDNHAKWVADQFNGHS